MKKVYIIIDNQFQKTASGFIKEHEKLSCKPDGVICIRPNKKTVFHFIKRLVRFGFSILKRIKTKAIAAFAKTCNMQTLQQLKDSWAVRNENSWDLLDKGIDIFQYANSKSIPIHFVRALSSEGLKKISGGNPSLFILYAGGILSDDVLSIPNGEFLNAHMGEMPRYRGMNVLEWAILENNKPRVNVMIMNNKIDDGDVVYEMDIECGTEKTIAQLRKTGYENCYKAMANAAREYSTGKAIAEKQSREGIRYYYRMHNKVRDLLNQKLAKGIHG